MSGTENADCAESERLTDKEYLEERKELYKYQQAAYESYEKTLLTLTGFFLSFASALLVYSKGSIKFSSAEKNWLMLSVMSFSISMLILLACFFVNVKAYDFEFRRIEKAQTDPEALDELNISSRVALFLYALTFLGFFLGVVGLVAFAAKSIQ